MPAPDRTTALLASARSARHRPVSAPERGPESPRRRSSRYGTDSDDTEPLRLVDDPVELPSRRLVRRVDGIAELPSGLVGARVVPPWAAVAGAALVALVAVAFMVAGLLRDRDTAEPLPTRASVPTASGQNSSAAVDSATGRGSPDPIAGPATAGSAPPAAAPGAAASAAPLTVHVVGAVRRPSVVRVPAGGRVTDAISAAGGPTKKAVLAGLNLARPVVDGEQIVVPDRVGAPVPVNTLPPPVPSTGAPAGGAAGSPAGAPLDLNTADQAALEALDGVGPVMARRIVEHRTASGRFTSVDELRDVPGIGDKTLEKIRPHVRV